jgi:hypothetical protein
MTRSAITYRSLVAADLARIGEIDHTERIEAIYLQQGTDLEERGRGFEPMSELYEPDPEDVHMQKRL